MTLDPLRREAWCGLTDLLRPPPGYRLDAALLTTFGLSFEGLLASLLAMHDVEEAGDQTDTIGRVIAATRTADTVRVLVHDGTITAPLKTLPPALASLLEPIVVPVRPAEGVFHPKLWLLRFAREYKAVTTDDPEWVLRVVIGSRNLNASANLELGLSLTGTPAPRPDATAQQLRDIVRRCDRLATRPISGLTATLIETLNACAFALPAEMAASAALRWQEPGRQPIADALPVQCREIIAISPFVVDTTVQSLLQRCERLTLVSNPTELAQLSAETLAAAETRGDQTGQPVLLAFRDGIADGGTDEPTEGEGESPCLDSVHAKALFIETMTGETLTLIGSANATARGWGLTSSCNIECVAVMRPGVALSAVRSQFLRDKQGALNRWLQPFQSHQRQELTDAQRTERELQHTAQRMAGLTFMMRYEALTSTLHVCIAAVSEPITVSEGTSVECLPFGCLGDDAGESLRYAWQPLPAETGASLVFLDVPLARVSPFLVVRVSRPGLRPHQRIAYATLDLGETSRQARDKAARAELLASTDPADVLDKLVAGLGFVTAGSGRALTQAARAHDLVRGTGRRPRTSLEQLLRAIIAHPVLARELTLLLGDHLDDEVRQFVADLEQATAGAH
jgi:hypothetical protein